MTSVSCFPSQFFTAGDIDITDFRKPMSYFREIFFDLRKEPCSAVQHPEWERLEAALLAME